MQENSNILDLNHFQDKFSFKMKYYIIKLQQKKFHLNQLNLILANLVFSQIISKNILLTHPLIINNLEIVRVYN